jgi:hypothetical protein
VWGCLYFNVAIQNLKSTDGHLCVINSLYSPHRRGIVSIVGTPKYPISEYL